MKMIITLASLLIISKAAFAQQKEAVNWEHANTFSVKKISFQSESIVLQCKNCKCFEIKTASGISGLLVYGHGSFELPTKHVKSEFNSCMMRFNPKAYNKLVKIKGEEKITDRDFYSMSMLILKRQFVHCYHWGSDALIPDESSYAVVFATIDNEDLMMSYTPKESVLYNFTTKKQY